MGWVTGVEPATSSSTVRPGWLAKSRKLFRCDLSST